MYQMSRSPNFPFILLLSNNASITSILELKEDYDYFSFPLNKPIMLSPKFHLPQLESSIRNFVKPKVEIIGSCSFV